MFLSIITLNIRINRISFLINQTLFRLKKKLKGTDFYEHIIRFTNCIVNVCLCFCYYSNTCPIEKKRQNY